MGKRKQTLATYDKAANDLARMFCEKYGYDYESGWWLAQGGAERPGTTFFLGDDYHIISFDDILTDHREAKDRKEYEPWYDYDYECLVLGVTRAWFNDGTPSGHVVNYHSWLMGAPLIVNWGDLRHLREKYAELHDHTQYEAYVAAYVQRLKNARNNKQ